MLDNKLLKVLDTIQDFCVESDAFKIFDADDILASLLPDVELTKLQLSVAIKELKELGFVNVKFFTLDEYCLSASPLAKLQCERLHDEQLDEETDDFQFVKVQNKAQNIVNQKVGKKRKTVNKMRFWSSFWGALLGALLGGGIAIASYVLLQIYVL